MLWFLGVESTNALPAREKSGHNSKPKRQTSTEQIQPSGWLKLKGTPRTVKQEVYL